MITLVRRGPETSFREYRRVERLGSLFEVGGAVVELFPIGVLAEALERHPASLRQWERDGLLPPARYRRPGPVGRLARLYSAAQVTNLHRLYRARGGRRSVCPHRPFDLAGFLAAASEVFDEEVVVVPDPDAAVSA